MKKLNINLKQSEVKQLQSLLKKGENKARTINRARILLLANKQKRSVDIAAQLYINRSTVAQIKKRYLEGGLAFALEEKSRPGQPRKYTEKDEAEIIATACSAAPKGRVRWTVRLLAQEMEKKLKNKKISREKVRLVLKKAKLSLG